MFSETKNTTMRFVKIKRKVIFYFAQISNEYTFLRDSRKLFNSLF